MMEKFEEYYKRFYGDLNDSKHYLLAVQFWQEATKLRDAQYELMAEHTELSIREDAVVGERRRAERIIDEESKAAINIQAFIMRVKERIEKDSE